MKRVYHFVPLCHGLGDLCHRRLKIAQIDDLNDPFDLWAIAQPDPVLRQTLRATKQQIAKNRGMLCFSLGWHNPLLWSHYADRHRGLALGFDVDAGMLRRVAYVAKRPVLKRIEEETANWLLFTKYEDWRYEQEARIYTKLKDRDPETGLYFADFDKQIVLREVIAGPLCAVTEQALRDATGPTTEVKFTRARLAFTTFRVVTDQRGFSVPDRQRQPKKRGP